MSFETKHRYLAILEARGDDIIHAATVWLDREAVDLQGKRPQEESKRLYTAAFAAFKAHAATGDYRPFEAFLEHVVEFRGDMGFRLSSLQRGIGGIKKALVPILKEEIAELDVRLELLEEVDAFVERVVFDLADRYQDKATRRLTALAQQAEDSSRAKSEFLARMSHEIRTPLNAILGFCQLLSTARLKSSTVEEIDEYLSTVRESASVLDALIDNILDIAKIESGRMTVDLEEIDLERLVAGVHEVGKADALKNTVIFTQRIDPSLPRYIRSDGRKLNQILMNLTSNAIKFTPEGHSVELSIERHERSPNELVIKVRDEGIGIPQPMQAIIFDEFEQGDHTRRRSQRGVGLGLAIARRLVLLLGGEIALESEPDRGSTFTVTLPLMEASAIVDARSEIDWAHAPRFPEKKVVVVDDDESSRRLLAVLLEDLAISVYGAPTGTEGVDLVARIEPDLVFVDMHLPDIDGIRVTQTIRSTPGNERTPIVMITGDARVSAKAAAEEVGIEDYITKPVQLKALLSVLAKHLS